MQIAKATIDQAFDAHHRVYVEWQVDETMRMWRYGKGAFGEPAAPDDLENLYRGLIRWQAFRGAKSCPTRETVHETVVKAVPGGSPTRTMGLTDLTPADFGRVKSALDGVCGLKVNVDGPSLVAASKCLHFLNPGLFVIVDRQMVGDFVLQHDWIRQQVESGRPGASEQTLPLDGPGSCLASNGLRYLNILLWAGGVMRDNPYIIDAFEKYVTGNAKEEPVPPDIRGYQAAAFEWMMLGLVHLPPAGVNA